MLLSAQHNQAIRPTEAEVRAAPESLAADTFFARRGGTLVLADKSFLLLRNGQQAYRVAEVEERSSSETTNLPPLPLLTFEQMTSVSSSEELKALYESVHVRFQSDEAFLGQVSHDWQLARKAATLDGSFHNDLRFEPIDVHTQGIAFHVYGIVHSKLAGKAFLKSVSDTIRAKHGSHWIHEQFLGEYCDQVDKRLLVSMCDQLAPRAADRLKMQSLFAAGLVWNLYALIRAEFDQGFASKKSDELLYIADTTAANRNTAIKPKVSPAKWVLPPYLELERTKPENTLWDAITRQRSAYQAAFALADARERGLSECNILVGDGHAPQVAYYLKHPTNESRLTRLAEEHAELAVHHPIRYKYLKIGQAVVEQLLPTLALVAGVYFVLKKGLGWMMARLLKTARTR